ncbi:MAG: ER protein Pkr1 [Rhodobacteraceae bacterium HLUCCA08]|nr:MAG: ER protein Pkr1 [Rhodobacteraceae bacterium HLUCCA08]
MEFAGYGLNLLIPALVLAAMGWLVPRVLSHLFPEGVRPLLALTAVAIAIMLVLGAVFFAVLYLAQGVDFAVLLEPGWPAFLGHFARLGAISGLFWAPILILSVAQLPKRWKEKVW